MSGKKIEVYENNNLLMVKIKKNHSFNKLNKELNNLSDKLKKLIVGSILRYDPDIVNEHKKIEPLEIYSISAHNKKYEIIKAGKNNILTCKKITGDKIEETSLEIRNDDYLICKLIHDLNGSTKHIKTYSKNSTDAYNNMNKKEAFIACKKLLDDLDENSSIKSIINFDNVYKILNIIPHSKYNPVISDEVISLCTAKKIEDINNQVGCSFSIVLNDTFEVVGDISFNYTKSGPSDIGNVIYNVKKEYRNNHYCTKALTLLKKLLENNSYDGDKSLYLATINDASIKVAKANGGILYEGCYKDENEEDFESLFDGDIKEEASHVTMFKINL